MDFLKPENLLRHGYKDCVLCEVERKGEEKRCERCSGRLDQRERILWEIRRDRDRRKAGILSLVYPGLGHFLVERYASGIFWASLLPLSIGFVAYAWKGPTYGHAFLLAEAGMIWWLAWLDVRRGPRAEAAPCQGACPAGIEVPDYIALVRENRPLEALALVGDKLPFPAFCGRACPHPCEQECVRNEFGAPIAIMALKRHAADLGYAEEFLPQAGTGVEGAPRIAVVGAGAAGLSAADALARLGCPVTVYDSNEEPGGMMRYGAAEFRFPLEAHLCDMKRIFARGIRFRGGAALGGNLSFSDLEREGFEAVLVAVGTPAARTLPGSGTEAQGFLDARSFLEGVRRNRAASVSGRVVVIGGGDVAIDSARTALRLGASKATIACIEPREEMPAHPWEVEEAIAEGVEILPSTAVKRFLFRDARTSGFEALQVVTSRFDEEMGIVPETRAGSEFEVPADLIVMAVGSRHGMPFLPPVRAWVPVDGGSHVFRLKNREVEVKIPVYLCGDCVSGPGTVVQASASGRAAALNLYSALRVKDDIRARYQDNYSRRREPHEPDRPEWRIRRKTGRLSVEERRGNFKEIDKGFAGDCARLEAERCARCNLWLWNGKKGGEKR